jgi:hypothetical protein
MTGKQQAVVWIGLFIIVINLFSSNQGKLLLSIITNKPLTLGKKVN